MKEKDKSLLEIAIELLNGKQKPQKLNTIIKEVMELKGVKSALAKELAPQFILDFMQSGYFIYCGDDCWDLKDRQPTSILDKDGHDYESIFEEDEDVKKNELKDEDIYGAIRSDDDAYDEDDDDDDDDDDENENDEDDLSSEFEEHFDEDELDQMINEDNE